MKKIKKTLTNFDTRILSHVKASPASFAKIIINEVLYQDFRFDLDPSAKVIIDKADQEKIDKKQEETDKFYQ